MKLFTLLIPVFAALALANPTPIGIRAAEECKKAPEV
ncbi:unnamed protein product [Rhizoctonia solani]|uniref:Uncharacterized protein n=1 Tax=Rhizoctonia solani TaxID=456999 RepID=A0A8H3GGB1_9AGAM|nr:unnamed protein product [Rhizoctonia solani]